MPWIDGLDSDFDFDFTTDANRCWIEVEKNALHLIPLFLITLAKDIFNIEIIV